jgi:hypothetical protein
MNFGVKNFTIKKTSQIETLMFEHYNFVDSMEQGDYDFFEVDL